MVKILRNKKHRIIKKAERKLERYILLKMTRAPEVYKMKTKIHSLTKENTKLRKLTKCMRNVFSEIQADTLIKKKNTKRTPEDMSKTIVIRAISLKAYDFLNEKLTVSQPSDSTLRRWGAKFNCTSGVLEDVLFLMEKKKPVEIGMK